MIEKFELKLRRSAGNPYHVPMRQWRKWSEIARRVFNEVYSSMNMNQDRIRHPRAGKVSRDQWKTCAWNSAWIAACAVMSNLEIMVGDK